MGDSVPTRGIDVQEALKLLRFRFRRSVEFRPVAGPDGTKYYSVNGKLLAEPDVLQRVRRALAQFRESRSAAKSTRIK